PSARSIMAIAAHPDDIESWAGGTLARALDRGAEVRLLLVTSGDKGSSDPGDTPADVAQRREEEACEAGRRLGLTDIAFLRYLDGEVENTRELRQELVAWIRYWKPGVLFTFDPEHPYPPYVSHRDHRAVGQAAIDAASLLARDPLFFPEQRTQGLLPHAVRELWLFASSAPTHWVDIGAGLDRKIDARLAHLSQTPDRAALDAGWRNRAAEIGHPADLTAAEAFALVPLD
ncbi:MAG TPA: PIG-L deacetylase family protein, partial [Thermomicrobiales bacterium]|nr:PIG-L deacetylase family protein [Thermomicrobiales bacterium]